MGREGGFDLSYDGPFNVDNMLRYLGRDPNNLSERVAGNLYTRHFPLEERAVFLQLSFGPKACQVGVKESLPPEQWLALHARLRRFLGLEQPLAAFYASAGEDPVMGPIIDRHRGLRVPQVPSLWEALCWAVIGQQINLGFAYRLRNRFIALGNGVGAEEALSLSAGKTPSEVLPFPTPAQVLTIPEAAWRPVQFSRQKIAYLGGLARVFEEGGLSQSALEAAPLEQAEATLLAVKGLGPWSVAYGLLRALGRVDALPVGDAGLRAALRHHYRLEAMPDAKAQLEMMEVFRPHRGLATTYFWRSLDQIRAG